MDESLTEQLKASFGYETFQKGQEAVIETLMQGHSAAAVFPTGGGKSLCYQLPAIMLPGLTIVVSPLIALMKDQIDALQRKGIAASRLDSSLSFEQYRDVMDAARNGELKLLYVAPERFNNERFREAINHIRVSLFAVDEAHCISEWGHNFRPDYLKLAGYAKECHSERVLALTATATQTVLEDIQKSLSIDPAHCVRTPFYRKNLQLITESIEQEHRDAFLIDKLQNNAKGASIIYVTLQKTAEELSALLCKHGIEAKYYHAGLKPDVREQTQNWFMESDSAVVVATIAFGMGIDKADIRYVYHYNLPKSLENYAQEIGRAGRDGKASVCYLLLCMEDLNTLENFVYGDTPTLESISSLLDAVLGGEDHFDVSLYELSKQHDIKQLVLRTLLTYLELEGYLQGGTPFYSEYQFKPLSSSEQILSGFDEPRKKFLASIFKQATKGRIWFKLDVEQVAKNLNTDRQRIIRALDYLDDKQLLQVKVAGVRLSYQRLQDNIDLLTLAQTLEQRGALREKADLDRLQQVINFVFLDHCQSAELSRYFCENLESDCGQCSWCLEGGKARVEPVEQILSDEIKQNITGFYQSQTGLSLSSIDLTRLLCGISTPKLMKEKLTKHHLFASLAHIRFSEIQAFTDSL